MTSTQTRTSRRAVRLGAIALVGTLAVAGCTNRNDEGGGGAAEGGDDQISVAFVPKLQGIPYFEAMNAGGEQAAEELGIEWLYQGPTTADAAAQADIVRSFIQQDVDALIVAPNDPDSMAPLLQEAADAGISVPHRCPELGA
jgi:rhamnose transport system substrate-binding protein